eukprot:TRINITY_DN67797_c1_g9_i1.p1 TRINITY_DN67797_c1_g9~~TRINITY_DN67797_c1_g9_i1.p1  ORF type:complete len:314 (-),score=23.47 TRINITY_DN67797_c1_g9_i1:250-1191(-)
MDCEQLRKLKNKKDLTVSDILDTWPLPNLQENLSLALAQCKQLQNSSDQEILPTKPSSPRSSYQGDKKALEDTLSNNETEHSSTSTDSPPGNRSSSSAGSNQERQSVPDNTTEQQQGREEARQRLREKLRQRTENITEMALKRCKEIQQSTAPTPNITGPHGVALFLTLLELELRKDKSIEPTLFLVMNNHANTLLVLHALQSPPINNICPFTSNAFGNTTAFSFTAPSMTSVTEALGLVQGVVAAFGAKGQVNSCFVEMPNPEVGQRDPEADEEVFTWTNSEVFDEQCVIMNIGKKDVSNLGHWQMDVSSAF